MTNHSLSARKRRPSGTDQSRQSMTCPVSRDFRNSGRIDSVRTRAAGIAHEMGRAIEIGEQPFVRIEDETVDMFDTFDHPAFFRQDQGAARPGRVHMREDVMRAADPADLRREIDRADAGRDIGFDRGP